MLDDDTREGVKNISRELRAKNREFRAKGKKSKSVTPLPIKIKFKKEQKPMLNKIKLETMNSHLAFAIHSLVQIQYIINDISK